MKKLSKKLALSASLAVLLGACGGSQPAAEAPPAASAEAPATGDFATMTKDQRIVFMKDVVMPKMKAEFQKFDPKHFATVSCATCHGSGAKDGSFAMPSPDLPKIPGTPEGFKVLMEKSPEMVKFMGETVVPTMASLLHQDHYDPKTGKGFGCKGCHTLEGG